jgi:mannose/cellobiose epimerase-like protein (N-acyl-D-glucosamine 2-epimerase family)
LRFTTSELEQLDASKEVVSNVAQHLIEAYMAAQASDKLTKKAKDRAKWLVEDAAELTLVLHQLEKFKNP